MTGTFEEEMSDQTFGRFVVLLFSSMGICIELLGGVFVFDFAGWSRQVDKFLIVHSMSLVVNDVLGCIRIPALGIAGTTFNFYPKRRQS